MKYAMIYLVLLMMSYSAPTFGQPIVAVRGGKNITDVRGGLHFHGARKSVRMGVSVTIPIRDHFGLQFGGDYVPKGTTDEHFANLELDIDYIEFSGLGIVTIISPRYAPSLYILVGPTLAFKVRTKGEAPLSRRYRDPFEFKTLDFGIAGGIGIQMVFSETMALKAEMLITEGLQSINKTTFYNPNYSAVEPAYMKNRSITFCIGVGFPYGRTGG